MITPTIPCFKQKLMIEHLMLDFKEAAASETLAVADIVCISVIDALEAINNPKRLKATHRN